MKELIGPPDRLRRSAFVNKERRCDATFAYQQIMVDVQRVVLHYTSRLVQCLFYVSIVLSSNIVYVLAFQIGSLCEKS